MSIPWIHVYQFHLHACRFRSICHKYTEYNFSKNSVWLFHRILPERGVQSEMRRRRGGCDESRQVRTDAVQPLRVTRLRLRGAMREGCNSRGGQGVLRQTRVSDHSTQHAYGPPQALPRRPQVILAGHICLPER